MLLISWHRLQPVPHYSKIYYLLLRKEGCMMSSLSLTEEGVKWMMRMRCVPVGAVNYVACMRMYVCVFISWVCMYVRTYICPRVSLKVAVHMHVCSFAFVVCPCLQEGVTAILKAAVNGHFTVLQALVEQYGGNVLHRRKVQSYDKWLHTFSWSGICLVLIYVTHVSWLVSHMCLNVQHAVSMQWVFVSWCNLFS